MGGFAWVTLATNDSYSLGALVLAHSLRQVNTVHQLAVLVTPGVTSPMREKLASVFNVVKEVNILDSRDEANLRLLQRPELGITFTKLHCWRLTQFEKCVFLDADTMVLTNVDELFEREELSAAPDVGWPDCFNSGVFVYRPSEETYSNLVKFALEKGSFDGGDQGLLNLYFSDWAHKDISKHLPFIYNLCSTACYSYLPAFKQFGGNIKIIHFIGNSKPWLQYFDTQSRQVQVAPDLQHLKVILQQWWNIFCTFIHPGLSSEMAGLAGAFARLTLGVARTTEQDLLEDHLRRQGWEVGNIDYMGRDSFDNIWNKICQTLATAPPPASEQAPTSVSEPLPTSVPKAASTAEPSAIVPQQSQVTEPVKIPEMECTTKEPSTADATVTLTTNLQAKEDIEKTMVSPLEGTESVISCPPKVKSSQTASIETSELEKVGKPSEFTKPSESSISTSLKSSDSSEIVEKPHLIQEAASQFTQSTDSTQKAMEPVTTETLAKEPQSIPYSEFPATLEPIELSKGEDVCKKPISEVSQVSQQLDTKQEGTIPSASEVQTPTETVGLKKVTIATQVSTSNEPDKEQQQLKVLTTPTEIPTTVEKIEEPVKVSIPVEQVKKQPQVEVKSAPVQTAKSDMPAKKQQMPTKIQSAPTEIPTSVEQVQEQPQSKVETPPQVCKSAKSAKDQPPAKTEGSPSQVSGTEKQPKEKSQTKSESTPSQKAPKEPASSTAETTASGEGQGPTPPPRKTGGGGGGGTKKSGKGKNK